MANELFQVNEQAPMGLNLRSAPDPHANNILGTIPFGNEVEKLANSDVTNWWRVQTTLPATTGLTEGFVNSKFLTPKDGALPIAEQNKLAVHLPTTGVTVTRQNFRRAQPLTETPPVKRKQNDPEAQRVSALRQLIDWFGVESRARYLPGGGSTFCNIYAYDYCYMAGAYLPRVWWNHHALVKLEAGQNVPIQAGPTVNEMTANALFQWFNEWGDEFGWRRTIDLTELQDAANRGLVCITVAQAKQGFHHGHGHIVATVPENSTFKALRQNGKVLKPVQSQAGAHNRDYVVQRWWDDGSYAGFGHWIHN